MCSKPSLSNSKGLNPFGQVVCQDNSAKDRNLRVNVQKYWIARQDWRERLNIAMH
jgi:hypothetical protein